jgi:hypothetical protein
MMMTRFDNFLKVRFDNFLKVVKSESRINHSRTIKKLEIKINEESKRTIQY